MTSAETGEFLLYTIAALPSMGDAIHRMHQEAAGNLRGIWDEVLSDVDVGCAKAVVLDMARGDVPQLEAFERDKFLPTIRRLANERRQVQRNREWLTTQRTNGREQTYRCARCLDSAFTKIWHPDTINILANGSEPLSHEWYEVGCYCDCMEGSRRHALAKKEAEANRKFKATRKFAEGKDLRIGPDGHRDPAERQKLRDWVAMKIDEQAERKKNEASTLFDHWNNTGELPE